MKNNWIYILLCLLGFVFLGLMILTAVNWFLVSSTSLDTNFVQKGSQLLQGICVFLLPAVLTAKFVSDTPLKYLRLQKSNAKCVILTIVFALFAIPAIDLFTQLNAKMHLPQFMHVIDEWMRQMEEQLEEVTEQMLSVSTVGGLLVNIFIVGMVAAICEEILFRGLILRMLESKFGMHLAVWLSAIIFSAIHVQFFGFLPRMLLGAGFGYMAVWSGSLWLPVIAHFINNTTGIIGFYLIHNKLIITDLDYNNMPINPIFSVACIVISIASLILMKKVNNVS
ncbi:MAG: CPBP family intramembrane metalloprotease [Prevotellaceae bacterium]|jgi:membrane protease YdiL (CAAX protease family)|nr:CPBP family intramembrane metalloprotease [Prevotellaceae bacterium]